MQCHAEAESAARIQEALDLHNQIVKGKTRIPRLVRDAQSRLKTCRLICVKIIKRNVRLTFSLNGLVLDDSDGCLDKQKTAALFQSRQF